MSLMPEKPMSTCMMRSGVGGWDGMVGVLKKDKVINTAVNNSKITCRNGV